MNAGTPSRSLTQDTTWGTSGECPSAESLRAFDLGMLSEIELLAIGRHLDSCTACSASIAQEPVATDTFVHALRDAAVVTSPNAEERERVRRICERACRSNEANAVTLCEPRPLKDDAFIGKVYGRCRLVSVIGRGGMGTVYEAIHLQLKKRVAVKLLASRRVDDPRFVARFKREVVALGGIDHPNVVRALDAGDDGQPFLVMELVDGVSASQLVESLGPLSVVNACEIVRQAAEGLDYIHAQGRVHRDIKPSNLLIDQRGTVKIVDLGLAQLSSDLNEDSFTEEHEVFGTIDYMSPEQARSSHDVDIRSDIYSLGCTLFKLLSGAPPFADCPTIAAKLVAHERNDVPTLRSREVVAPVEIQGIVSRMMAKSKEDRYWRPNEVANALRSFTQGSDIGNCAQRVAQLTIPALAHPDVTRVSDEATIVPSHSHRWSLRRTRHWRTITSTAGRLTFVVASLVCAVGYLGSGNPSSVHNAASDHLNGRIEGRPPTRIWPTPVGAPRWRIEADGKAVRISKSDGTALCLGEAFNDDIVLTATVGPFDVGGELGVFLGLKENVGMASVRGYYQLLGFYARKTGEVEIRFTGFQYDPKLQTGSKRIARPYQGPAKTIALDTTRPHLVEIVVRDRELSHVSVDGLVAYNIPRGHLEPIFFDAVGEYGIYATQSTGVFSQVKVDGVPLSLHHIL